MKPTAANVSKALSAAGHVKSESYSTRIRGWHEITMGFRCQKTDDGCKVEFRVGYSCDAKYRTEKLAAYAATLTAAGFCVEQIIPDGRLPYLKVTGGGA